MLVDNVGDVTITNDGATILSLLEVTHPAVRHGLHLIGFSISSYRGLSVSDLSPRLACAIAVVMFLSNIEWCNGEQS
jgi:hypothetical protein